MTVGGTEWPGVAEFLFFTGPMDCGKSTLALQFDYTHAASGRRGRLFTSQDRAGESTISSRLGLAGRPSRSPRTSTSGSTWSANSPAASGSTTWSATRPSSTPRRRSISWPGSSTSCRSTSSPSASSPTSRPGCFPARSGSSSCATGSRCCRCAALCWCGARATHNARTFDGRDGHRRVTRSCRRHPARDEDEREIAYEVLCRRHHRQRGDPGGRPRRLCPTRCRSERRGRGSRCLTRSVLIEPAELAGLLDAERPPVLADVRWVLGGPPQQAAVRGGAPARRALGGPGGRADRTAGSRRPAPAAARPASSRPRCAGSASTTTRSWWRTTPRTPRPRPGSGGC